MNGWKIDKGSKKAAEKSGEDWLIFHEAFISYDKTVVVIKQIL